MSLQYLENELRHLCALNPIPTPYVFFDGFKNELRHLCALNRIQIFQKFSAMPWTDEPPNVLKLIVDRIYG